jgi:hypothetical protein
MVYIYFKLTISFELDGTLPTLIKRIEEYINIINSVIL